MNKYLEKDIRIKLLKMGNEPITQEDLELITDLGLNNNTFSNKPKNIDLSEIERLVNLRFLTLQNFQLSDAQLDILCRFGKLKILQISFCDFVSERLHQYTHLDHLIINNPRFDRFPKIIFPKAITINNVNRPIDISDLQGLENVEILRLNNIKKISNFKYVSQMSNLKELNIDGSFVDDKNTIERLEQKIVVSHNSESLMIR